VLRVFLLSLAAVGLLEWWRPCYFLTDDNLSEYYPLLVQMGRSLGHGQAPLHNPYLLGGTFDLRTDATFPFCWHPLVWLLTLLQWTPAHGLMLDVLAAAQLILAAVCFSLLLCELRTRRLLAVTDGMAVALSLSYAFTAYTLLVGASWVTYLAPSWCLPLAVAGMVSERRAEPIALCTAALVNLMLLSSGDAMLFAVLWLFAAGLCAVVRSPEPWRRLARAGLVSLVLLGVPLQDQLHGYMAMRRSAGLDPLQASQYRIPFAAMPTSLLPGLSFWRTPLESFGGADPLVYNAVMASAAGWLAVLALFPRWRRGNGLGLLALGLCLLSLLLIARPAWLAACIAHVPLLKATRWPFRQIYLFQFCLHLWLATRLRRMSPRVRVGAFVLGTLALLFVGAASGPPSLSQMWLDRHLLFQGDAGRFWSAARERLPGDAVVIAVSSTPEFDARHSPCVLLGTHNYASLFKVCSLSVYSSYVRDMPWRRVSPFGVYDEADVMAWARFHPHVYMTRMVGDDVELCTADGRAVLWWRQGRLVDGDLGRRF
jgi:hypothetical protein